MKVEKTIFKNTLIIKPEIFTDHRGKYVETYNWRDYNKIFFDLKMIPPSFVQDDFSYSHWNVLRGMHGDDSTWELVSCLRGQFQLVIVDCDKNSPTYKQHQSFILDDVENVQVLIPPLFANGHYCISDCCIFNYKQSTYYQHGSQFTVAWNDSSLNIPWKCNNPILSERDSKGPFLILYDNEERQ